MVIMETERLELRKLENEDTPYLHAIFSDVETMKYYPTPFSYEKTQYWVIRNQKRYEDVMGYLLSV